MRRYWKAAVACAGAAMLAVATEARADGGEMALAERLAMLADDYDNSNGSASAKIAFYQAASRLAEPEIRFRRMCYRAAENAGDIEVMLSTLQQWRKLEPENLFVQMRLVDCYLARMQTTDAKLAYLKTIIDADSVDQQVRSHAAVQAARVMIEQSRASQAAEMARKAIVFNPLNKDALDIQWFFKAPQSTPLERVNLLLAMLKANPAGVELAILMAKELADVGMVEQSVQWYAHAMNMSRSVGGLDTEATKEFAAQLLLAGQDRAAAEMVNRLLERNNADTGAWFLTLTAEKQMVDRIEAVKKSAMIGLLNHLAVIRQSMGIVEAATRPLTTEDVQLPDLSADQQLLDKATAEVRLAYAAALSDIAWFLVYYQDRPADAKALIEKVKLSAPQQTGWLIRLDGWRLLREGKLAEAKAMLSQIADQDPFAAMGLLRIVRQDPASRRQADELAIRLFETYRSGPAGAMVRSEVGELSAKPQPQPVVDAIHDSLDHFPQEILRLAEAPQQFISMRLTPRQVGHDFGEPILMSVELRNVKSTPINLGPSGLIQDLWIDAQLRGLMDQWVPGVMYEKVDGPLILAPGKVVKLDVRLDRGPLLDALNHNVLQSMQISVYGLTNAVPTEIGVLPGPCGMRAKMVQLLERRAASLASETALRRARATIEANDVPAKLRLIDQITAHLRIVADPEGAQQIKLLDVELREMLTRLAHDASPVVRAWARYRRAQLSIDIAETLVGELAADPVWYARFLGAASAMETPAATRQNVIQRLLGDSDPTVRRLAETLTQANKRAAATQPADEPTGLPALPEQQ